MSLREDALKLHKDNRGKLQVVSKVQVNDKESLSLAYTPGVAEPCKEIQKDPDKVYEYTFKGNMVAVVTDGTLSWGWGYRSICLAGYGRQGRFVQEFPELMLSRYASIPLI